jgi:hypothetical protein
MGAVEGPAGKGGVALALHGVCGAETCGERVRNAPSTWGAYRGRMTRPAERTIRTWLLATLFPERFPEGQTSAVGDDSPWAWLPALSGVAMAADHPRKDFPQRQETSPNY